MWFSGKFNICCDISNKQSAYFVKDSSLFFPFALKFLVQHYLHHSSFIRKNAHFLRILNLRWLEGQLLWYALFNTQFMGQLQLFCVFWYLRFLIVMQMETLGIKACQCHTDLRVVMISVWHYCLTIHWSTASNLVHMLRTTLSQLVIFH